MHEYAPVDIVHHAWAPRHLPPLLRMASQSRSDLRVLARANCITARYRRPPPQSVLQRCPCPLTFSQVLASVGGAAVSTCGPTPRGCLCLFAGWLSWRAVIGACRRSDARRPREIEPQGNPCARDLRSIYDGIATPTNSELLTANPDPLFSNCLQPRKFHIQMPKAR